ncbi:L-lactate permease [Microbacterium album]|uniref:L-lactate permease n=1 Tax=Microbacterium album TaxID=2053191 RepID=UPI001665F1E2|nr:L-lactate permease [Microbacterium album]
MLAGAPIVALLAMLVLRIRTMIAALAALGLLLILSFEFPIGGGSLGDLASRMSGVLLSVVLIMYGGILLAEMLAASGAQDRISAWLNQAAGSRDRAIFLIAFTVVPLAESAIGWGVGIVVGVPLLIRVGLPPARAATAALLGMTHNAWGSLGLSLLLVESMSGQPLNALGFWAAVFTLPVLLVLGVALVLVGLQRPRAVGAFAQMLVVVLVIWGALLGANLWVSPSLAGVAAPLAGLAMLLGFSRVRGPLPRLSRATVLAFAPYCFLITSMAGALTLAGFVDVADLRPIVTSPALWLVVTAAVTPPIVRLKREQLREVVARGTRIWFPAFTTTSLFILFGSLLSVNGMGDALAAGAARLGAGFVLIVPIAGALAGYLTVSNLSAASIVTPGTTHASSSLGLDTAVVLGAQNAVSSTAILASPARVVLAATLASEMGSREDATISLAKVTGIVAGVNAVIVALVTLALALMLLV